MANANAYEQAAAERGFTDYVELSSGCTDLAGWVRPDTDFDDRFTMVCADTGETLRVNGWLFVVEG